MESFHFYSYDPTEKKFAFDETLRANTTRELFIEDMINVTNKVFSVILHAYTEGLQAIVKKSQERSPVSHIGSSVVQQRRGVRTGDNASSSGTGFGVRRSTANWDTAFALANECMDKFKEPVSTVEEVEKQSCDAIELLTKSVLAIPRVSHFTGDKELPNKNELRELACHIVRQKYTKEVERHVRAREAG